MLKISDGESSSCNTDNICEQLIPADSFYRKFREIIRPLISDEHFKTMYCPDNGRPAISPALLATATILQFYRDLSDRQMEKACMYDIEIKYALGLRLDDRPFDHSSLGDFRKRLLQNGREKEIFERILTHLVEKGLIEKNEIQRIDATHVIADLAIPTMVTLVKKGVFEVLKLLYRRHPETIKKMETEIPLAEYTREAVNHEDQGRMDMGKKKKQLVEVVAHAHIVLEHTQDIKNDHALAKRVEMLKRILRENITKNQDGTPTEIDRKDKPGDILVSPIDSDARYGAKSNSKKFTGYKANITETAESRFITNIKAMRGNSPDGKTAVATILEQRPFGIEPSKIIGDTAYGEALNRKELQENGMQMVAPLKKGNTRTQAVYPKSMFDYDEMEHTLTCPQGITTRMSFRDYKKNITVYHFPMTKCNICPVQKQCTNAKEGRRTVGMNPLWSELRKAEQYNLTAQFKDDMKLRPPIEGTISELTRYHGLRRARYRGLNKVSLQCYFTAVAVNIKRWIKIMLEKMKPKIPIVVAT